MLLEPQIGRKRFLALVFEAKLTDDPEELFYVGGLAERYYHGFMVNEDDQEWMRKV
jgi:hypothetical protein